MLADSDNPETYQLKKPARWLILPVLVVAFTLRLINIGRYSLWSDEAGQVLAALQPRFDDFLRIVRSHVMAMPLDYMVTRLITRFTLDEGLLRLPSAIWGVLAVLFLFLTVDLLFRNNKYGRYTALITAFLLAVSPVHVFYSQEIRFYSALNCFYWSSNFLLMRFLLKPKASNLIFFTLSTLIGVFFHPYVALVFVNAFIFLLFYKKISLPAVHYQDKKQWLTRFFQLAISALIIFSVFLVWVIIQKPNTQQNHELFLFTGSFINFMLSGMTWRGYEWCQNSTLFGVWEYFLMATFVIGLFLSIRSKQKNRFLIPLLAAYALQVMMIVAADFIRGYWVALRQIIHLAPILFIVNAFCFSSIIEWFATLPRLQKRSKLYSVGISIILFVVILGFAAPRLDEYYKVSKSNARDLITMAQKTDPETKTILINPGYYSIVYEIYLVHYYKIPDVKMVRSDLSNLAEQSKEKNFLIAPTVLSDHEIGQISQYYNPVYLSESQCWGDGSLYISK